VGEDASRVLDEQPQQAVLGRRQLHGLARHFHGPVLHIDAEPAGDERSLGRLLGVMADGNPHSCDQLPGVEWFDHVIVGAGVQEAHDLLLRVAHREDDHRHRRPGAELPERLRAVPVRKAEVQEHDVGLLAQHSLQAFRGRAGTVHLESLRLEAHAEETADLRSSSMTTTTEVMMRSSPSPGNALRQDDVHESPPLRLLNAATLPP